ncbi:MAG: M17 family peptidase N-terminal domain-containing protein, partial [Mariprofundaceae bacterium]|nr:M17 family peptidase N-terminal domain-containing protein [Mariprofundaceae bacterium]
MIDITVKAGHAHKQHDDAVVLPLLKGRKLTASGTALQQATGNALSAFLRKQDIDGTFGRSRTLYEVDGTFTQRVLLIGSGEEKKLSLHKLRALAAKAARKLDNGGAQHISLFLCELAVRGCTLSDKVQAVAEGVW